MSAATWRRSRATATAIAATRAGRQIDTHAHHGKDALGIPRRTNAALVCPAGWVAVALWTSPSTKSKAATPATDSAIRVGIAGDRARAILQDGTSKVTS